MSDSRSSPQPGGPSSIHDQKADKGGFSILLDLPVLFDLRPVPREPVPSSRHRNQPSHRPPFHHPLSLFSLPVPYPPVAASGATSRAFWTKETCRSLDRGHSLGISLLLSRDIWHLPFPVVATKDSGGFFLCLGFLLVSLSYSFFVGLRACNLRTQDPFATQPRWIDPLPGPSALLDHPIVYNSNSNNIEFLLSPPFPLSFHPS
ncbi:hypothetical protein VTJ04DRAFT_4384 [Mycothermus thermophilus]|uniref:uncharacterized protein n=1 Tax=Humicola insolens TaxID=85995 RepID=UPI003744B11E